MNTPTLDRARRESMTQRVKTRRAFLPSFSAGANAAAGAPGDLLPRGSSAANACPEPVAIRDPRSHPNRPRSHPNRPPSHPNRTVPPHRAM